MSKRATGGDIVQSHKCGTLLTLVSIASSRRRTMRITLKNFVQKVLEIVMFIYNEKRQMDNKKVSNGMGAVMINNREVKNERR